MAKSELKDLEAQLNKLSGELEVTMEIAKRIALVELKDRPPGAQEVFDGLGAFHASTTAKIDELLARISHT